MSWGIWRSLIYVCSLGQCTSIYIGLCIFVLGSLLSYRAQSYEVMLVGRVLQGFGAAAPRVSSIAILSAFMCFTTPTFFCLGLLFGNLNAMAMEPMGHLAGVASSVIGALTSAISLVLGSLVGQLFNMTLIPLVSSYLLLSLAALSVQLLLSRNIQH